MINVHMIKFRDIAGDCGHLTPIESSKDLPFDIKRIYYITKVPNGITRGFHAHKKLEQVLICLNGSVKIRVKTLFEEEVIELDDPAKGLYIGHMVWREMFDFSDGGVLMVLASEFHLESDYIRSYDEFEKEAKKYFGQNEF